MRLGVNARRLAGQRLGVGRYIEYMIRHWATMLSASDRVSLYVREPVNGEPGPGAPFRFLVVGPKLTGLLWENLVLPARARGLDVLYCPSYTVPLVYPGPCVLAIHSVNEVQSGTHPSWYQFTYSRIYKLSAQKAHVVIVPSDSTREDLELHYGIPGRKIRVVPLGVDEAFRPGGDEEARRATRAGALGADRPFVLFVGKLSQRRNIPILLEAFAAVKRRAGIPHSLMLVGPNHLGLPLQQMAKDLGIADSVVQTDGTFTDHRQLVPLYNAADLFVHPSSYEGFCLPLVEAMACGVPVVTVNRSALGEIVGDAALTVEEPTAGALEEAISRALTEEGLRARLRARGLERARAFRWEDTARRTLDILREVAQA